MTKVARRRQGPVAEMLGWFDLEPGAAFRGLGLTPLVRVEDYVQDNVYILRAEMPGIDPNKDLEVKVEGDLLTIHGERREEEKHRNRHEFHYGSFERSITLPQGAKPEEISAEYHDGVLELNVPFDGEAPKGRKIPVQRAEGDS